MSKYNSYARKLDEAFKTARDEYSRAFEKLQETERKRGSGTLGTPQRQRAELDYKAAKLDFEAAEKQIWDEFNRQRTELRQKLTAQVSSDGAANPDAIDNNGLELLKSGILSANDYYVLANKYASNPTMLRIMAKYVKEAADSSEYEQTVRGNLYILAEQCRSGHGETVRRWDELSRIADYCSGQSRDRRDTPTHTISMGKRWEELSGGMVERF